jgi:membrane fusion protein (multidrug efflux system)
VDQTITKSERPATREQPATPGTAPPRTPRRKSRLGQRFLRPRSFGIAAVALAALAYGGNELYMRLTHVYEYDARVTADMITMASRVDGWVLEMAADEGAVVQAGQIIVRIDDRTSRFRADALDAQILGLQADQLRLQSERRMVESQSDAKARARTSGVRVSEAASAALEADLLLAVQELERTRVLYDRKVVTDKQLQTAQAAVARLESQKLQMAAERAQAEGNLQEAIAERDRVAVIDGQLAAVVHLKTMLEAQLRQQQIDIEDRTVRSPVPAVIDRQFVKAGEYVAAGQRVLMLHNPNEVWIEANIKETQVRKLKVGQTVKVSVDAFPDDKFIGRVARIGSATTARFALLPTPNPSGNFTKITQRVAVKIDIVEMPRPLAPGMMVEVDIDVR